MVESDPLCNNFPKMVRCNIHYVMVFRININNSLCTSWQRRIGALMIAANKPIKLTPFGRWDKYVYGLLRLCRTRICPLLGRWGIPS